MCFIQLDWSLGPWQSRNKEKQSSWCASSSKISVFVFFKIGLGFGFIYLLINRIYCNWGISQFVTFFVRKVIFVCLLLLGRVGLLTSDIINLTKMVNLNHLLWCTTSVSCLYTVCVFLPVRPRHRQHPHQSPPRGLSSVPPGVSVGQLQQQWTANKRLLIIH